jgi:predicted Ser/Thr protein kinase
MSSELESLTVNELRAKASQLELRGYSKLRKAELVELLLSNTKKKETKEKKSVKVVKGTKNTEDVKETGKESKYPSEFTRKKCCTLESKFVTLQQLGQSGKEGTVFLTIDAKNPTVKYAMKTFRKKKSGNTLEREAYFQYLASQHGVSPKIIEYNPEAKYIVMEMLDKTLFDILREQQGRLTLEQQKQIIELYEKLDQAGVMNNDANPLNIMEKKGRFYMIDFGFAKLNSHKDFIKYKNPNQELMPLGLLLWMKQRNIPTKGWEYIRGKISSTSVQKMGLDDWP